MGGLSHTVSGDIASFRTPSRVPIESLKFHFLPKQEGSGDPSPTNVRPITGWTGLNGRRAGKNIGHIVNFSANSGQIGETTPQLTNKYGTTLNTITYSLPDTELVITQTDHDEPTETSYKNGYFAVWMDNLEYDKSYDVSFRVKNVVDPLNVGLNKLRINGPSGGSSKFPSYVDNDLIVYKNVLHAPYVNEGATKNRKGWEFRICGMSMTIYEIMVTPANKSDGVYEPYSGERIPITFPNGETIYGGYVDLVRGKIVATYAMYGLAWKDWSFGANLGNNTRKTFSINYSPYNYPKFDGGIIKTTASRCNVTNYYYNNNSDDIPHYYINSTGRTLYATLPNDMDENTVVQISSVLAEPIEYDIDPISLQAFLDHNNFWSDANDITEVTYAVTESKDILATRKKAQSFNNYFQGELVFELNGDDPPIDGAWVDRVNGMDYRLSGGASYDSVNKIYDFSGRGIGVHDVIYRDPFSIGHHFRIEWDVYFRRAGTTNGHFFDLGSLGSADAALGIGLLSKNANTITFNWKMQGNGSNPFGVSGETRTNPNTPIEGDTNYTHFVGFHEIIPWNDGYDRLRIMINGRISRYETQIPKVEYTQWRTANGHFSVGAGVYNWMVDDRPDLYDPDYETDIKVRSIKIYKYD